MAKNRKFKGILEEITKLSGLTGIIPGLRPNYKLKFKCLEDGNFREFYRRINEGESAEELESYKGIKIELKYRKEVIKFSDFLFAKITLSEPGIPRKFDQFLRVVKVLR